MHSNSPDVTIDESNLPEVIVAVCHKGTQTLEESEHSSYRSLTSKATSACYSDDASVKILDYSARTQENDPNQIAIPGKTFSEETVDPNDKLENTFSRYTYCREVIRPFMTDYSADHQASDDELLKEVIKAVHEDFEDFQPCFDSTNCSKRNKSDSTDTNKIPTSIISMVDKVQAASPSGSKSSFFPVTLCPSNSNKNIPKDKEPSSDEKKLDPYDDPYDPCSKPKCPKSGSDSPKKSSVCPEEIQPCKKPRAEPKTPPPPYCADNSGPHCTQKLQTGCETPEQSKELAKARKNACGASPAGSNTSLLPPPSLPHQQRSVLEAHCEALDTVKQACSVAIGKVYESTKETVTLIRAESAKHLEKIRAYKSECDDTCYKPQAPPPSPKEKDPSAKKVSNIMSNQKLVEEIDLDRLETLDGEDLLHKMVEKIESTISMISEHIDFNTVAEILKSDSKNAYDRPTTPPQKLKLKTSNHSPNEHPNIQDSLQDSIHEVIHSNMNTANNMFTAIKSKIFSIFSDMTNGAEKAEEHPGNQGDPENEENPGNSGN